MNELQRQRGATSQAGAQAKSLEVVRADLLSRLGLDARATSEDLAEAHESVELFLSTAPRQLGAWARSQASSADEAYALLTDPAALARTVALGVRATQPVSAPGGSATPPVRRELFPAAKPAANGNGKQHASAADVDAEPSEDELAELIASVTPSAHRDSFGQGRQRPAKANGQTTIHQQATNGLSLRNRLTLAAAGIAVVAVVGFAGYRFGGGGVAAGLPVGSPAASSSIDMAAVGAFMQKIAADPKDTASLQGLADLYYAAGDYTSATEFLNKILAYDGSNVRALLGLGAAAFNSNDSTAAEAAWKKVVTLDAKSVEAHYDLGFLYLNLNDLEGVRREWTLVIQLDPGSEVAKNVQAHLDALDAQASASPAASGSQAPGASPAATPATTPAASPAASGSAQP
jgi:cytochrome c-type biogenesis protein CcmH/NrfG